MKDSIITEFVNFKVLETTTGEQLMSKADNLVEFQKKLDGYIDSELVKDVNDNAWQFVYHYENLEKVKVIGEKLRSSKEFGEFISLVVPDSIRVAFNQSLRKW